MVGIIMSKEKTDEFDLNSSACKYTILTKLKKQKIYTSEKSGGLFLLKVNSCDYSSKCKDLF